VVREGRGGTGGSLGAREGHGQRGDDHAQEGARLHARVQSQVEGRPRPRPLLRHERDLGADPAASQGGEAPHSRLRRRPLRLDRGEGHARGQHMAAAGRLDEGCGFLKQLVANLPRGKLAFICTVQRRASQAKPERMRLGPEERAFAPIPQFEGDSSPSQSR